MPYIKPTERDALDPSLNWLIRDLISDGFTAGMFNYVISRLADAYIGNKGINYTNLNAVVGVFESAKAEFQRRVVARHEDDKRQDNGEVYENIPDPPLIPETFYPRSGDGPQWLPSLLHDGPDGYTPIDLPEEVVDEGPPRQSWHKCRHPECDLHVIAPGHINCAGYCIEDGTDWNQ